MCKREFYLITIFPLSKHPYYIPGQPSEVQSKIPFEFFFAYLYFRREIGTFLQELRCRLLAGEPLQGGRLRLLSGLAGDGVEREDVGVRGECDIAILKKLGKWSRDTLDVVFRTRARSPPTTSTTSTASSTPWRSHAYCRTRTSTYACW